MTASPTCNHCRLDRFICAVSLLMRTHSGSDSGIQDDTGAIAIESPPNGLGAGQLADVQARKTHAYDPATGLASVALAEFRVSARNLPQREKSGTRVQLTAVIHSISKDEYGAPVVAVGDSGFELRHSYRRIPRIWFLTQKFF